MPRNPAKEFSRELMEQLPLEERLSRIYFEVATEAIGSEKEVWKRVDQKISKLYPKHENKSK